MEPKFSYREYSLIPYEKDDPFPLENIPFGVFQIDDYKSCCTRISNKVIDLGKLQKIRGFEGLKVGTFEG